MLDSKTSQQGRPITSSRRTPVICSAALLKKVMRHSASTVRTPSATQSSTAWASSQSMVFPFGPSGSIRFSLSNACILTREAETGRRRGTRAETPPPTP